MITTNFYNDLKEVKDAKEKLIKNLNATSDIKYDNTASINVLAEGVLNRNNTLNSSAIDYTEDKDHYWEERPDWYPDTKALLNNASEITVDGTVYYPLYILLIDGVHIQDYFNKTFTTSGSANVTYYNGTGGDAYLFSDTYDPLADNEGLEIGTAIVHKWDMSKDIVDPTNLKSKKLRWVIVYGTTKTISKLAFSYGSTLYTYKLPIIEMITGECTFTVTTANQGFGFYYSTTLEYMCFQDTTTFTSNSLGSSTGNYPCFGYCRALKSLILPEGVTTIYSNSSYPVLKECYSLTYIKLPSTLKEFSGGGYVFENCRSLPFISIPKGCTKSHGAFCSNCYNLKEIDISMLTEAEKIMFGSCYSLKKIYNGNIKLEIGSCYALEYVDSNNFSSLNSATAMRGSCVLSGGVSYTNVESATFTVSNPSISYNPLLETIYFEVTSGNVSGSIGGCDSLKNIYYREGVTSITTSISNQYTQIEYLKLPTTLVSGQTGSGNICVFAKYIELWNDFDLAYCFGSNSWVKSIEWFKDLCVWLKNNTGLTAKTITLGSYNLEIMKQIYLTYNPDNVNEITWVEQGTDGAINIVEYITGVKNWTLS